MATTANYGWPKVALSDQPNAPAQIDALADAVDTTLKAVLPTLDSGVQSMTSTAATTPVHTAVTFAKSFASAPNVQVTVRTSTPHLCSAGVLNITTAGFDLYFARFDSGTNTNVVEWVAILP